MICNRFWPGQCLRILAYGGKAKTRKSRENQTLASPLDVGMLCCYGERVRELDHYIRAAKRLFRMMLRQGQRLSNQVVRSAPWTYQYGRKMLAKMRALIYLHVYSAAIVRLRWLVEKQPITRRGFGMEERCIEHFAGPAILCTSAAAGGWLGG
jgi:hypothetical protein